MEDEKNKCISKIVHQFLGNRFSEKTEEKVQQWIIQGNDSKEKEQASLTFWNTLETEPNAMTYQILQKVNAQKDVSTRKRITIHYRKLWCISTVIIPFLMLAGGSYYFFQRE